jgi:hypothetical protein
LCRMSQATGRRFGLKSPALIWLPPMIISLAAALERAIEAAIFIDGVEINHNAIKIRIEALTEQLIRHVKNLPTQFIAESDEAAGIAQAVAMIEECVSRIRSRHFQKGGNG